VGSTAAAGLTGDGFHLSSTSIAIDKGDPSYCPANDRDGTARPQGVTCDAGADEFASGGGGSPGPSIGDLNSDSHVNITDLSILLSHYNQSAIQAQGDINQDGIVTILDLSILLSHYGM
jgi:hypothetical protein